MLFDTHLTEEFDALRDTVKRMCDAELAPRAAGIDAKNEFPADMWRKLGDLGLLGDQDRDRWDAARIDATDIFTGCL